MRAAAFPRPFLAALLLLAGCSRDAPARPPSLPTLADTSLERECACVTAGDCQMIDAFEGESETRGFQCTWDDQAAGRATCTYESRFKHADPPDSPWSSWSKSIVRLRHLGDKGWCWYERE
ncbi:MAG TPA: hypothetical protein VGW34_14365 [Allosphingosinicella sp.]|nr:hypothetical protein [Allosphingosinicella sp.]